VLHESGRVETEPPVQRGQAVTDGKDGTDETEL
jgi:hypothetical protein